MITSLLGGQAQAQRPRGHARLAGHDRGAGGSRRRRCAPALVQSYGRISARPQDGATAGLALSGSALSTAAGGGTGGTGGVVADGGRLSETAELDGGDAIHIFSLSRTRSGVCVVSCVQSSMSYSL